MKITAIRLRGKLFDDRKIQAQVDTGLNKAAVALTADFGKTVSTWKDKPKFETHKIRGGRVVSSMNKIYFFISEGTRVRYATMTPNFQAKTAPGRLQAGAGAGGVLFINKKRPRPGIKARRFDKQLIKIWRDKLQDYIQKEIKQ